MMFPFEPILSDSLRADSLYESALIVASSFLSRQVEHQSAKNAEEL